ncbi:MAG: hypothetical protein EOP56_07790 [Sphingobacteriales bacterium]|nr:MAG: hypothetical protein EOP56_07790 [Sphingobacteriales bacterium]
MSTTASEYILFALGNNGGEIQLQLLLSKLLDYGIAPAQAAVAISECIEKNYLIESANAYKLTPMGDGMYKAIELSMPAWPMDDVRTTKEPRNNLG